MEIDVKNVIKMILENIYVISDKEYQERVWIRGEGPECDSFCDTVNDFSNDVDPVLEDYQFYGLTKIQYSFLKRFRMNFKIFYKEHHWEPEFIDSPEWHRITEMAKEVLKVFDYNKEP